MTVTAGGRRSPEDSAVAEPISTSPGEEPLREKSGTTWEVDPGGEGP